MSKRRKTSDAGCVLNYDQQPRNQKSPNGCQLLKKKKASTRLLLQIRPAIRVREAPKNRHEPSIRVAETTLSASSCNLRWPGLLKTLNIRHSLQLTTSRGLAGIAYFGPP